MTSSLRRRLLLQAGLAAGVAGQARAADTPVKISLDFRVYGANCPFVYANALGYFREEGIEATIDGAAGSGDCISRVASGAYDFGFADIGTLVEFCARNPDASPKTVMTILDRPPHCIISFKKLGIAKLRDLIGRKLGTGNSDATARLLPALLQQNGIDLKQIDTQIVDIRLRDTMLMRGAVDAVAGFDYTIIFNLAGNNVTPGELQTIMFSDNGFDFYGNGLIASRAVIERNPDLVRKVARASARGWVAASKDPAASVKSLLAGDPLTPTEVETQRLSYVISKSLLTDSVRKGGMGQFDPTRAERGIKTIVEGFGLPRRPSVDEIYDGRFLPPIADRTGFAA